MWIRARQRCEACARPLDFSEVQLHHIVPVSCGGVNSPSNLVCLCSDCHIATFTYPDANLITRTWECLPCGCQIEIYRWRVKPSRRILQFFERIGLHRIRRGPSDRLKVLCRIHGRKHPDWAEPSMRWMVVDGRRMRVKTGGLMIRCKPHPGDLLNVREKRKPKRSK